MIRFRPYPGMTVVCLISILILIGLGKWQLDRLNWKLGLIAAADTRAHASPVSVESLFSKPAKDIEYTHAAAQGEFLNDKETYLYWQLEDGRIGLEVMTPLRLTDGRYILIDRGFVPPELKDPAKRMAGEVQGETRVTGLVRAAETPGLFTPAPDLAGKVWYGKDVAGIGRADGIQFAAPLILSADKGAPGVYPEGGHTRLVFRNDHLQYALTWFSLAGVLVVVYFAYHWTHGRIGLKAK